jgi:hypothetical protein
MHREKLHLAHVGILSKSSPVYAIDSFRVKRSKREVDNIIPSFFKENVELHVHFYTRLQGSLRFAGKVLKYLFRYDEKKGGGVVTRRVIKR